MTGRPEQIKKAKVKVARYCAMGERSPRQVRQKLEKVGLFPSEIDLVIDQLTDENFIDADRFCRAFVNDKLKFNKWGRNRIRLELKTHQISSESIEQALKAVNETLYRQILKDLLEKKWKSLESEENPLIKKKKSVEYAIRKGFETDLVFQQIEGIMSRARQ